MRQDLVPYIIKQNHVNYVEQHSWHLVVHVKWHYTCLCYTKQNKLGWEREFKEFGQNLRKFGSLKKEFRFQAVEALQ